MQGHVEERVLDAASDDLGSKPTSAISQLWTLSKLYNLSQPQFFHLKSVAAPGNIPGFCNEHM